VSASQRDKDADRAMWACGSYARVADIVEPLAEDLISLAGITPGERVLDVGTGTGNAALAAARAGAAVTASDLTPELLAIGADRARSQGLAIDWVEADAEDLRFPDGSFDVVVSCLGAMFAPDHARTARELLRVCRAGGRIALANWTPGGYGGAFFALAGRHTPPGPEPPASEPSTAWGEPSHVHQLFGTAVGDLRCTRRTFPLAFTGSTEELFELYRDCFGPVMRLRAALLDQPARLVTFDDDLRRLLREERLTQIEYLAVIATRGSA
jgi:SAM-dependent methyltransferase